MAIEWLAMSQKLEKNAHFEIIAGNRKTRREDGTLGMLPMSTSTDARAST
jgi:hypothetical protein